MKKIGIIILNYKNSIDTKECVDSLDLINTKNLAVSVYIVNNGKEGRYTKELNKAKLNIIIIDNKENLGFSGGCNIGIKEALSDGQEQILLLNNDTLVDKDFVLYLSSALDAEDSIGIVSPKIYFAKGYEFHKSRYKENELGKVLWYAGGEMDFKNILGFHRGVDEVDAGQYDKETQTPFATGCSMLVKKEVFEKIGFLDERYFLYYEDSDFCMRTKRAGYKIMYAPKAIIWHKNAGSSGSGSALQDYYITRNRLLFGMQYGSIRAKLAIFRESLRLVTNGRPWQKRAVADFYKNSFGQGPNIISP